MSFVFKIAFSGANFSALGEGIGERKVDFFFSCFIDQLALVYPNELGYSNHVCLKIFWNQKEKD